MKEKLRPYLHLLGKVADEKLAEMAGLTLEELAKARAELMDESAKGQEVKTTDEDELYELRERLGDLEKNFSALEKSHRTLARQFENLSSRLEGAPNPAPASAPKEEQKEKAPDPIPAGTAVKVIRNGKVKGEKGMIVLRYGDILTGELAAFLVSKYPQSVEQYPKARK